MTVRQLKEAMEKLEKAAQGDTQVYFDDYAGHINRIDEVELTHYYPVIILNGMPMDDECEFLSLVDSDGRERIVSYAEGER
jgi:hypothetical protein